ncbi:MULTISPECIES: hypothetical protein [Pseudomonas]|uniref:hypothetical protein n=1 Tax=Pseudomonas TaxID=286 RepID=UPI000C328DA3|nr:MULTISPECIES: hypothetical protein [Pseudomonas]PWD02052.1 hypothetical protein CX658_19055 [Pseudomonas amygdali pv. lachrymans]WNZ87470.1 hypothetical protein QOM10_29750 [Pseudomonas sp. P108]
MKFFAGLLDWLRPSPAMISSTAKDQALITLARHGYQAHYYTPHSEVVDGELSAALRLLGRSGFLITNQNGDLVGAVETAHPGSESRARQLRAKFRLVK